ncbi:MAG: bifunctional methylenetetrahydrofolate dehydrogenase/methenyltetrahydrofolate cyclohydrolase FolD [Acidobacteria bacterium]|nr:bifunctional methylenetetrahydrofolate dehydrogenase/methenyltetrahydrofolate cyclohydrolase FolD [Acidobacteriota bacterium]
MAVLMDGKALARKITDGMRSEVEASGLRPGLAVILVGENPASAVYVKMKERACEKLGFFSSGFRLPADVSEDELATLILRLNNDPDIHGILLQLPIPGHLNEKKMLSLILPDKDVDGFHPVNVGRLMVGDQCFVPCTPRGIMALIDEYDVELKGKRAVVIGRSNIVGKPVAMLLLERHATVTICHSRTKNLADLCREADVLIAAVGRPYFVDETFVKLGAVVVDVGVNRVDNEETAEKLFGSASPKMAKIREKGYVLCGDVNFESVEKVASLLTPVPGGVGPLTIAMLMKNTFDSAKRFAEIS